MTTASTSESFRKPIQPRKPLSTLRWRSQGGVANRMLCVDVRTWRTQGRFRRASAVDQADKEDLSFFADEYVVSIKNPSRFSHEQTGVDMWDAQDPHDCGPFSSTGAVQSCPYALRREQIVPILLSWPGYASRSGGERTWRLWPEWIWAELLSTIRW